MKSRASHCIAFITLLVCLLFSPAPASFGGYPLATPPPITSWQRISELVGAGFISPEQAFVFKVIALYKPERLPRHLRGTAPEKCGTPLLIELESAWWTLPAWLRSTLSEWPVAGAARQLRPSMSRPGLSGPEKTLTTPHFLIHYTLSGPDAVSPVDTDINGIPDYIDGLEQALEYSHSSQVGHLGWLAPPSDEPIDPGQPAYDVYIKNLSVDGLTYPEGIKGDNEHSPGVVERHARYSYIVINPHLAPEILQVTAAHEYNHAIQFGYNGAFAGFDARRWLMEGTATWMEGQVFPAIDDKVSYLTALFSQPDQSLAAPDNYYASWLFFQYLEEQCGGPDTLRAIWEISVPWAGDFSFKAIRSALAPRGCNLDDAFAAFCVANLFMFPCELAPGPFCYRDALLYLTRVGHSTTEGHVSIHSGERVYVPQDGVEQLACDYIQVDSNASVVAAGGYAPLSWATLQGMWVGERSFDVTTEAFLLTSDASPTVLSVSPHQFSTLYILVANLTDPTNSEIRPMDYGLTFTVLNEASPTPYPTPEAFFAFLPVICTW